MNEIIIFGRSSLLHSIKLPDFVSSISLQPGTHNRDVFALSCVDEILRLFDIRCSANGIIIFCIFLFIRNPIVCVLN